MDRAKRRRGPIPIRRLIPNVLTTIALCCGLASVHFALKDPPDWNRALWAIAIAAVFDALDGRAARLLRVTTRFGAVLDSLADFLSFGVVPALLLYQWMLKGSDVWGLTAVIMYVLCSALRLARFTAMPSKPGAKPSRYFIGLPTPAAAGAVLIPLMIDVSRTTSRTLPEWVVVAFTLTIAALMVSRVPVYSIKAIRVRRYLVVPLMVVVGLFVVLATKDPWLAASVLAGGYLAAIPFSAIEHARAARTAQAAPTGGPV